MKINFKDDKKITDLGLRVRSILGVPEEYLTDEIITSPDFVIKAQKFINKKIEDYEELDESLLTIAFIYYICYLLCFGMHARLPKQMENVNTKTVLQSIDWDSKALEMLNMCNETLEEAIAEIDEIEYGDTFAVLSDSSEYPNTMI